MKPLSLNILLFLSTCHLNCSGQPIKKTEEVRAISLCCTIPLEPSTDTFNIFYYKDIVLYECPYHRTFSFGDSLLSDKIKYYYFIYQEKDKYGFISGYPGDTSTRKLLVDSFIRNTASYVPDLYDEKNDSLLGSFKNSNGGLYMEKYIPRVKPEAICGDTSYFYYSDEMKDVKYSLSPKLDQLKKLKVSKFVYFYKETYVPEQKITVPERSLVIEMKNKTIDQQQSIEFIEHLLAKCQGH